MRLSAREDNAVLTIFWRSVDFLRVLGLTVDVSEIIDCYGPYVLPKSKYIGPISDDSLTEHWIGNAV
jgi:hypothetical protein